MYKTVEKTRNSLSRTIHSKIHNSKSKLSPSPAFTIVELLIVIIIIGILAVITIVSYSNITAKAAASVVQSDINNAIKQLEIVNASMGEYPSQASANIVTSSDVEYVYIRNVVANKYCLQMSSSRLNTVYHRRSDGGLEAGKCNYLIGDSGPAGGLIFYIDSSKSPVTYYEVAPSGWSGGSSDPVKAWCASDGGTANSTNIGTLLNIGYGKSNTNLIASSCSNHDNAAQAALDYVGGGYRDWYLPSYYELVEIYNQRSFIGGLGTSYYWSSSEYNNILAKASRLTDGGLTHAPKNVPETVRPIRSFQ